MNKYSQKFSTNLALFMNLNPVSFYFLFFIYLFIYFQKYFVFLNFAYASNTTKNINKIYDKLFRERISFK